MTFGVFLGSSPRVLVGPSGTIDWLPTVPGPVGSPVTFSRGPVLPGPTVPDSTRSVFVSHSPESDLPVRALRRSRTRHLRDPPGDEGTFNLKNRRGRGGVNNVIDEEHTG